MNVQAAGRPADTGLAVTPRALAWLAAIGVFVLVRLFAAMNLPVFGAELVHLSGAWQASIGVDDTRFIPTLFQALTALWFEGSSTESGPRMLALAVSCTIPAALWLFRSDLGHDGALAVLLLLSIEPLTLSLSATASAMAVDSAVALWVLLLLGSRRAHPAAFAGAGFAAAVCGPAVLFAVLAWAIAGSRGRWPVLLLAGGFVAGVLLASVGFGFGPVSPVVPPLDLVAASSEQAWSTGATLDLALLYALPLLLGAGVAAGPALRRRAPVLRLTLVWSALSLSWGAFSLPDNNPAALAALTLPLAILAGFMAPQAVRSMGRLRWRIPGALLGGAVILLALAWAILADWARVENAGSTLEQVRLGLFLAGACLLLGVLAVRPAFRPALLLPLGLVLGGLLIPAAAGLAGGGASEPLASPYSPDQARQLRSLALSVRGTTGGEIVVHPSYGDALTWPFRGSGVLVVASVVPPTAAVLLWPPDEPAPEGFVIVEGDWALTRTIRAPTADLLDSLHWFLDRNTIASRGVSISVYTREQP